MNRNVRALIIAIGIINVQGLSQAATSASASKSTVKLASTPPQIQPSKVAPEAFALPSGVCIACTGEGMMAGGTKGTYFAMAKDLAKILEPKKVNVIPSSGTGENIKALANTYGVTMAFAQGDLVDTLFKMQAAEALNPASGFGKKILLKHLRVVMPLYREEVYVIVRANKYGEEKKPINSLMEIKDRPIWLDQPESGSYHSAWTIYGQLFRTEPIVVEDSGEDKNSSRNKDNSGTDPRISALQRLAEPNLFPGLKKIDAIILVGGQPYSLLQDGAIPKGKLKILEIDPYADQLQNIPDIYKNKGTKIKMENFPAFVNQDNKEFIKTLSVQSYLLTANFQDEVRNTFLRDFARTFCAQKDELLESKISTHDKWKSVTWLERGKLPSLPSGWKYSPFTYRTLNNECLPSKPICSPAKFAAGLCNK